MDCSIVDPTWDPLRTLLRPLAVPTALAQVWAVELTAAQALTCLAHNALSGAERALVAAALRPSAQQRRRLTLALTRIALADILGVPADSLALLRHDRQAPTLPHTVPLYWSVSHSNDWFLLAWSRQVRLGVDVEFCKQNRQFGPLAELMLRPEERAQFSAVAPTDQVEAFYAMWTAKEALLKAHGLTLADGLAAMRVRCEKAGTVAAVQPGETLYSLPVAPDYAATLALLMPPCYATPTSV